MLESRGWNLDRGEWWKEDRMVEIMQAQNSQGEE